MSKLFSALHCPRVTPLLFFCLFYSVQCSSVSLLCCIFAAHLSVRLCCVFSRRLCFGVLWMFAAHFFSNWWGHFLDVPSVRAFWSCSALTSWATLLTSLQVFVQCVSLTIIVLFLRVNVHSCLHLISNFYVTFMISVTWLSAAPTPLLWILFFLFVCLFCRSLTSNLPNVNLPNVNLQIPKVPNLPVPVAGLSVNLPQMPSFSTPSWMAAIYDSECVFN